MTDQAAERRYEPMFLGEPATLSLRRLAEAARPGPGLSSTLRSTLREVSAIEYLDDGIPTFLQLGTVEERERMMWMVCGIYEPEAPDGPWVVAHVARWGGGVVLRRPFVLIEQSAVTRVYDGIDDA